MPRERSYVSRGHATSPFKASRRKASRWTARQSTERMGRECQEILLCRRAPRSRPRQVVILGAAPRSEDTRVIMQT